MKWWGGEGLSDEKLPGCTPNSRSGPPFPDTLLNGHPLKKREEKGKVKDSATKWLLSRVRISLRRLFWALVWSPPEVLCISTVSAGLNWKAQSSPLCSGAFRSAGPGSLAMKPAGAGAGRSRVSPGMMHRTWSLQPSSAFSGRAPRRPAPSYLQPWAHSLPAHLIWSCSPKNK